jgi:hypothetical protein
LPQSLLLQLYSRAEDILLEERKAVTVPGGLDVVAADLEQVAATRADAAKFTSRKLWCICTSRNAASIHPRTIIKECIKDVMSHFLAKAQRQYDELDNPSALSNLSYNIKLTLQQLYKIGILATHTFAAIVDDVFYCMNECLDDSLNGPVADLLIIIL